MVCVRELIDEFSVCVVVMVEMKVLIFFCFGLKFWGVVE